MTHLVTYATPRFYLRQNILGLSARANEVADTITAWNPNRLLQSGIEQFLPEIDLNSRGSGYWAWKPYIIHRKLHEIPNGDIVFYCDVGRRYPFKTLEYTVTHYCEWMRHAGQDVMPGVHIPWKGPMSMWTKRAAFQAVGLDTESAHRSAPIQASFSLWIAGDKSRKLCADWLRLCSQAELINDDLSPQPTVELADYFEHRHDQSLLSLCCLRSGIHGINLGSLMPEIDTQHPDAVLELLGHRRPQQTVAGRVIHHVAKAIASVECMMRRHLKFGENRPEPISNATNSKPI